MTSVLEVRDLTTEYTSPRSGTRRTLDGLSFEVHEGEILGIVGETGAGKSVLVRAVIGLLSSSERVVAGDILFEGGPLPVQSDERMVSYRGAQIALIQSGSRARLDPVQRIGAQLVDVMKAHRSVEKAEGRQAAETLIRSVGISDAVHQLRAYPHELSGGMCQRVVVAMALANAPRLLMADEPTAGLDVTIQIQILDLFRALVAETGAASLLVTRDLANVAHYCDRVLVLRSGCLVEQAPVKAFFADPQEEYSRDLIRASMAARGEIEGDDTEAAGRGRATAPSTGDRREAELPPLLQVRDLVKHFGTDRQTVHAVNDVSFTIGSGETLALVGESGSGKTTVGRCVVGLLAPTAGEVLLDGAEVKDAGSGSSRGRALGSHVVFQEPRESLNPRWTLGRSIEEPLIHHSDLDRAGRAARLRELLELVHLPGGYASRYPHQVTAGEQQRVAIARSVAANPKLVVLDEPTSALDPSVRARTIDLLVSIQEELGLSYLFISHDMTAVKMIAHRIAIMYLGRIVELARAEEMFGSQVNPYGRALLSSVLYPDPWQPRGRFRLEGEIPSAIDLPTGCPVSSRCPLAVDRCSQSPPPLDRIGSLDRWSACFRTDEILAAGGPDALQAAEERPVAR